MENSNYRKIRGRRGKNSKNGINYMSGYFVVQFFDEKEPETFVINDKNTDISNNELKSTSPLAKAVMHNKPGASFYIEDYLEKNLNTKTGVSIIKKKLKYLNYNPEYDDKVQYNYYYVKSYLDYVKSRGKINEKEFISNGKKIYINQKFVPFDRLNRFIDSLTNELELSLRCDFKNLSEKHRDDVLLKISKLKDLKNKNFYDEDLDFIKLDIQKYIYYELSYYETFDLYITNMIKDINKDKTLIDQNLYNDIIKNLNNMLKSNTIGDNNIIYNKIYKKLNSINRAYLSEFNIEYSGFNYKHSNGYEVGKRKELDEIISHYRERFDKLNRDDFSDYHYNLISEEINKEIANNYSSNKEYEKHLDLFFRCEVSIFKCLDSFGKHLIRMVKSVNGLEKLEKIFLQNIYTMLNTNNIEDLFLYYIGELDIIDLANKEGIPMDFHKFSISGKSWKATFKDIYDLINYKFLLGDFEEHNDILKTLFDFRKQSENRHKPYSEILKERIDNYYYKDTFNNQLNNVSKKDPKTSIEKVEVKDENIAHRSNTYINNSKNKDIKENNENKKIIENVKDYSLKEKRKYNDKILVGNESLLKEKKNKDKLYLNKEVSINHIIITLFFIICCILSIVLNPLTYEYGNVAWFILLCLTIPYLGFIFSIIIIPSYGFFPFFFRIILKKLLVDIPKNNHKKDQKALEEDYLVLFLSIIIVIIVFIIYLGSKF